MGDKSKAEFDIISAALFWFSDVMRLDRDLTQNEQNLFDAILHYKTIIKPSMKLPPPSKPIFPKPPKLPSDLARSLTPRDSDLDTIRYSERPTDKAPSMYSLKDTIIYDLEENKED